MSAYARNFLRLRFWFEGLDGGEVRSFSPYEQRLWDALRSQASHFVEAT